jgi:hypothetical protein
MTKVEIMVAIKQMAKRCDYYAGLHAQLQHFARYDFVKFNEYMDYLEGLNFANISELGDHFRGE